MRNIHHTASARANSYPEVTNLICRLPLPTLYLSTRDCSPQGPDADWVRSERMACANIKNIYTHNRSRLIIQFFKGQTMGTNTSKRHEMLFFYPLS